RRWSWRRRRSPGWWSRRPRRTRRPGTSAHRRRVAGGRDRRATPRCRRWRVHRDWDWSSLPFNFLVRLRFQYSDVSVIYKRWRRLRFAPSLLRARRSLLDDAHAAPTLASPSRSRPGARGDRGGGNELPGRPRGAGKLLGGGERLAGRGDDDLGGHAELVEQALVRGRGAEVLDGHGAAGVAQVLVPRHRDAGLDGHAGAHGLREHRLAVLVVLLVEPVERRGGDDAGLDALAGQHLGGLDGHLDLGARGHQDDVRGTALGLDQDVGAAAHALGGLLLGALEHRDVLAGQGQGLRAGRALERGDPRGGGLIRVRRAQGGHARHGAQGGQLLDRLVSRAVLAETDGVVRPHVERRDVHQRRQADRRAHVVGEDEERATVRAGAAVQGDAVEDR